jgi:hypothetical protein
MVQKSKLYHVKISNRFQLLKTLDDNDMDNSRAWGNTEVNMKASATDSLDYYELKKHGPCFNEESSKLLNQG